jgi:hypothetical protein
MALGDRARRVIGKDRDALETLVRVLPFLTARLNVVGPQGPDVANVKPHVSNDRIRPRLLRERLSFAKTSSAFSFNNLGKPDITC